MRLVRRHSLILVGVASVAVSLGIGIYFFTQLSPPMNILLLVGLPAADIAAFFALWLVLRRRDASPSSDALTAALHRGRPVVIDIFSNT